MPAKHLSDDAGHLDDEADFDNFFGPEENVDDDAQGASLEANSSSQSRSKPRREKESAKHSDDRSWRERFREWRQARPFAGGLLMLLSGIIMVAPAYFTVQISDLLVMISTISGVSTLLIGALLIMFGIGTWLQPYAATYLGVLGIIVAIIAVPTSNLGGFFVGSLLGIIGGALALGWEREPKRRSKHSRRSKAASGAKSVIAVTSSVSLVACMLYDEPKVSAQEGLPQLPTNIQLPELPQLPTPQLPTPQLPTPKLPTPELPPEVSELANPQPVEKPLQDVLPGNISTVRGDNVTLNGNVRATLGMVNVGGVPHRTLILTGDELRARNLSLEVPGFPGRGLLTTGQVDTTLSNGPVRIVATGLTATPTVAGVPTLPVTVDLGGDLGAILQQLGVPDPKPVPNVPVPNMVMNQISLSNASLQLVSLSGVHLHAPKVQLSSYMR